MTKRPVFVVMSGLPGVGKSTLARTLANATGAIWLRVDTIEEALAKSMLGIARAEDAGYAALMGIARDNLRLGHDVIADSVNPVGATRAWYTQTARDAGAALLNIHAICSDSDEHARRIAERPDLSPSQVAERDFDPWPSEVLTLDLSALSTACAATEARRAMDKARAA